MAATDRDEAIAQLRKMLRPGDTVYTVVRHVSRSGMQRSVSAIIVVDGEPGDWSGLVARAIGQPFDWGRGGVKVAGCGTDAGLSVVMSLGYVLWPDGFGCIGERCPSNDHVNGDRDHTRDGVFRIAHTCKMGRRSSDIECSSEACVESVMHWHRSGGYALRARWL